MSCGAKYSVPDGRLQAAGVAGLRVRCAKCRAIMVVSESQRFLHERDHDSLPLHRNEEEDTRPMLARKRRQAEPTLSADGLMSVSEPPTDAIGEAPAALSASGVFRPLPGVQRNVTGFFFPELEELKQQGKQTSSRLWYVAIDNRPRGPFSATEVISLAEKGKVRDATLVWRPGFGSWTRVKHGEAGSAEDLSWLQKVVQQRKVREREAQREAEQRLGIRPMALGSQFGAPGSGRVQLSRTSAGARPSTWGGGVEGMPPPLPPTALEEGLQDDPSGLLPLSSLLEDAPQPFEWRATPTGTATHTRDLTPLFIAVAGAVVAGTVAGLLVAAAGAPWARLVASLAVG